MCADAARGRCAGGRGDVHAAPAAGAPARHRAAGDHGRRRPARAARAHRSRRRPRCSTYTLEFARQTPDEFVRRYLVDGLRARTVVVGRDVRFGWNNSGDLSTMVELGRTYGFDVEVIEDVTPAASADPGSAEDRVADPLRRRWSSTWVRELLDAGDVVAGRPRARPSAPRPRHGRARRRTRPRPGLPDGEPRTGRDRPGARRRRLRRLAAAGVGDCGATRTGSCPRRSPSAPTRRSTASSAASRPTCSTAPTSTSTTRWSCSSWSSGCARRCAFDSIDDLVVQMHDDVDRAREILRRLSCSGVRDVSPAPQPDRLCAPSERPRIERARVDMPRRTAQRDNQENRAARKCRQAVHHDRVRHPRG